MRDLTFTIWAAQRQKDAKVTAERVKGSALENGADCSGFGLEVMVAFTFCTQL